MSVIGWCECCGKILEKVAYEMGMDDRDIYARLANPQPHYLCKDCLEKILKEKKDESNR